MPPSAGRIAPCSASSPRGWASRARVNGRDVVRSSGATRSLKDQQKRASVYLLTLNLRAREASAHCSASSPCGPLDSRARRFPASVDNRVGLELLTSRCFPPPWLVDGAAYVAKDSNGQKLDYVYYEEEPGGQSAAKLFSKDEARRNGSPDCHHFIRGGGS